MRQSRPKLLGAAAVLALVVGICWAATSNKLYLNGKLVSTNVRVLSGHSYVPVADIATAFGTTAKLSEKGYELNTPGGANQVEGAAQGKIGDELFTGQWRFKVLNIQHAGKQYVERYYQAGRTIRPPGEGDELLVVNCRLKNGTEQSKSPILTERLVGNTALADTEEHSYPPYDFDARQEINKTQSYAAPALLPGAAVEFAILFSVPEGTTPKALVLSIMVYPDDVGKKQFTNVRVTLRP